MVSNLTCGVFYRQYKKDMRTNSRAVNKLRVAVETCKRVLSTVGAAQCSVDSLYEGIDFNSTLSRLDICVLTCTDIKVSYSKYTLCHSFYRTSAH